MYKSIAIVLAAIVLLVAVSTVAVLSGCAGSSGDSGTALSAETVAYVDDAMPKLDRVLQKFDSGNVAAAAKLWKSIGDIPTNTAADEVLSGDYLTYANNVRYYMIGDGSVTLKELESSREKAKTTLASLRP